MAIGFPSTAAGVGDVSNATGSSPTNTTNFTTTFGSNYQFSDWSTFNNDGTKFYAQYRTSTPAYGASQWDLTIPYDLSTATNKVDRPASAIGAFAWTFLSWSSDGLKAYMAASNGGIAEYACSSAFNISNISTTITFTLGVSGSGSYESIWWKNDGTKLYANKAGWPYELVEYTLSTPWTLSTASASATKLVWSTESVQSHGIAVSLDGTKIYLAHNLNSDVDEGIWQYDMTTPWDISTASYNGIFKSTSADGAGYPSQMHLSDDGTRIFFQSTDENGGGQSIFEYVIPAASPGIFTTGGRDFQYNSTKGAWEVYAPITVAQTGSPVSDLSELADSTSILNNPANTVQTYADLASIVAVSNPTTGQLAFKSDTSDMYIFGGTNWQKLYDEDDVPPPAVWYGDRGVISLGDKGGTKSDILEYVDITTTGNSTSFGTLTVAQENGSSTAGGDRMVISLGMTATTPATKMEYVTTSSPGTATSFGDLSDSRRAQGGVSNGSRGCFGGGPSTMQIDYITIATESNATAFGTHSSGLGQAWGSSGAEDGTYGLFMGIDDSPGADGPIDYITIATESNATLFGQLTSNRTYGCAVSDSTKAVHCGGAGWVADMHYVNIATPGNSTSFGSLSLGRSYPAGTSNNSRGIISGGYHSSSNSNYTNSIEYIDIATISSASSFGTISSGAHSNGCASSGNAA